jgi:glycosyltransferase involved in cell wall biosynthesis
MISVIIPTYKEPEALDICLRSAIEGQLNKNQIIVVVDGFYNINKEVLEKYKNHIDVLDLEENQGLCRATNLGVYNAINDLVLIVNDDNVFPHHWDIILENDYVPNSVISPNQIEPTPSMFQQFHIKDLGKDPKTFDLKAFWDYELNVSMCKDKIEKTGSTLPVFMNKYDYLRLGGWDESYPGAWVVDWEFFMKCEMAGMEMLRTYNCHFYHFVSLGTKTPERIAESQIKEQECHEHFRYKWGTYARHNPTNNSKLIF